MCFTCDLEFDLPVIISRADSILLCHLLKHIILNLNIFILTPIFESKWISSTFLSKEKLILYDHGRVIAEDRKSVV